MEKLMLDVLNKTYDNPILRRTTIPLFMSNPGIGKSTIIRKFAKERGVHLEKITLSQRMPNEVTGGIYPDYKNKKLDVFDSHQLENLKDGDILFFDETFNGTLKQTLDAVLNLLEDRTLPSGKKLADVMIVAASNPQGLINITPQIKERFIKYDLKFNPQEFEALMLEKYGMPYAVSRNLSTLIQKEKFESGTWAYITPRSVEKSINQIGVELQSAHDEVLIPYLSKEIDSPMDIKSIDIKKGDKVPYITFLKLIIKHANENCKQQARTTADMAS